jgi:hypothetical protein
MGTESLPDLFVGGDNFRIFVAELYDDVGEERAYAGLLVDVGIEYEDVDSNVCRLDDGFSEKLLSGAYG